MPKSRAAFDLDLDENGIPHKFRGLALYWWTAPDLYQAVKDLGGTVNSNSLKTEVCQQLHVLKTDAFEPAEYEQTMRQYIEDERTKTKAAKGKGAVSNSSPPSSGEKRGPAATTAGTTTAPGQGQAYLITRDGFESHNIDDHIRPTTSASNGRSTLRGRFHRLEVHEEFNRLVYNGSEDQELTARTAFVANSHAKIPPSQALKAAQELYILQRGVNHKSEKVALQLYGRFFSRVELRI